MEGRQENECEYAAEKEEGELKERRVWKEKKEKEKEKEKEREKEKEKEKEKEGEKEKEIRKLSVSSVFRNTFPTGLPDMSVVRGISG